MIVGKCIIKIILRTPLKDKTFQSCHELRLIVDQSITVSRGKFAKFSRRQLDHF